MPSHLANDEQMANMRDDHDKRNRRNQHNRFLPVECRQRNIGSPEPSRCSTAEKIHHSKTAARMRTTRACKYRNRAQYFLAEARTRMTVPSDTKATTAPATNSLRHRSESLLLTAVADNPQPITRIIDAITIGGMRRSIHAVPMHRISRAHAMNINPRTRLPSLFQQPPPPQMP